MRGETDDGLRVSPGARQTLRRIAILPSWLATAALLLFFATGFDVPEAWQYLPFAVSLVFLGLPHGAVDHLVPARLSGRGASLPSVLGVVALYAVLVSGGLALWFAAPAVAFVLFIAVTWFHWGQGDLYSLRALLGARYLNHQFSRALAVFVRGGLPMLVPLISFPEVYESVAQNAAGLFEDSADRSFLFGPAFGISAGAVFAVATLLSLAMGYRRSGFDRGPWFVDAGETLLLLAYFAIVPPILAVGAYFCLWHAPRHIARLMLLDEPSSSALERGYAVFAVRAFVRDSAPLTLAALCLLVGLYFLLPEPARGPGALLGVYLVLISVLTPPHVAIVSLMDRRQGLWR